MPIVCRVFGRTPDTDLLSRFSSWMMANLDAMDTEGEEDSVQGTMTIDFQHPTSSFVVEVQTYHEDFATLCVEQMKKMGFENASTLGVDKEGGIQ